MPLPPRSHAEGDRRSWMRRVGAMLAALALGPLALANASAQTAGATAAGPSQGPRLLVVGDSLSAEYGIARGTGWVPLLQKRLRDEGYAYQVVNASISGDTTSGGVSRLPALLSTHQPALVIVELGGNDALRGQQLGMTEQNLDKMVATSKAAGAKVLVAGIQIPPNYGRDYTTRFNAIFKQVADRHGAALVPFLLEGIADNRDLFQPDGIHPVAGAQARILDNVWPALKPLLSK